MAKIDNTYQQLLKDVLSRGYTYDDPNRKGVKRTQLSDYRIRHNILKDGYPVLTLRKIHTDGGIGEFVSFMNGENNIVDLQRNKVNFWNKDGYNFYKKFTKKPISFDEYTDKVSNGDRVLGDLGKIYPHQMRNWGGSIDQIKSLVKTLQKNPMATKKTVTMWNPSDMVETSLSPCHWSFEALVEVLTVSQRESYLRLSEEDVYDSYVSDTAFKDRSEVLDDIGVPKYGLSIKWHQHSVDVFLGLPTNLIYYANMCITLAKEADMIPMDIIGDLSNVHLYDNAIKPAYELLKRDPNKYGSPSFKYRGSIDNLKIECFTITDYDSYENIKVEMLPYSK